jgi:hypothetical protein
MTDFKIIQSLWLLLFFSLTSLIYSQEKIILGEVLDQNGRPLESANITAVDGQGIIFNFAFSDEYGQFSLDITSIDTSKTLYLEAMYLGYKKERKLIGTIETKYTFNLLPEKTVLDEVLIKDKPLVERASDTLIFNVKKFAKEEDRSIGDVLNRLPGITVGNDGTIYYNNEKIENLYIHGDDLMAGKYGLATKAIKKEDIVSIDVIRNHQPIKVLKDKIFSDKVAVNLVLKNEDSYNLSGQAQTGLGFPELYDVSVTPIILNKRLKVLNQIAANNSGIDYRIDFKELGVENMISSIRSDDLNFSLSQGTVTNPDLPTEDYYINNSGSINLNNLYTFENNLKVRLNIQGLLDRNSLNYTNQVINYTTNDTINFDESQSLVNKPSQLLTSINISKNEENFFFNNNFKVNFLQNNDRSTVRFNNNAFSQNLISDKLHISNDLNWIPKVSTQGIFELRFLTEYKSLENRLQLDEGYTLPISNGSDNTDLVRQDVELPLFYIDGYLSYKFPNSTIKQDYRLGYISEKRDFNSSLMTSNSDDLIVLNSNSTNNLDWLRSKFYFTSSLSYKNEKIRASVELPVFYQTIKYEQQEFALDETEANVYFNPSLNLQYALDIEKRISFNYTNQTTFGNLSELFRGIVLQNYRSLISNNANLQVFNSDIFRINYSSEKASQLSFFNVGLSYRNTSTNNILFYEVENDIIQSTLLPFENNRTVLDLTSGFSKYSFPLKTKFSFDSSFSQSTYDTFLNGELAPFKTNSILFSANLSKSFLDIFNLDYNPKANWNFSRLQSQTSNEFEDQSSFNDFRLDQTLNISVTPNKISQINLSANYILIQQNKTNVNGYFLTNLSLRHNIAKNRIQISLDITNLFNTKTYRLFNISENQQSNSNFELRGRMLMARLSWFF